MIKLIRIEIVILILVLLCSCKTTNSDININTNQFQVPLLKGISDNPLLRISLNANDTISKTLVTSVEISLDGTDDLADFESLSIWCLGSDSSWKGKSQAVLFGKAESPASIVNFKGNQKIESKTSYFFVTGKIAKNANIYHKVNASCLKVTYNDNTFSEPVSKERQRKQRIGVAVRKHMDDNVHTYRIPGLTTTNNGTLLSIYDIRRESSRDLQGDIDIGLSRSTDGGNTWEPMRIGLDMGEWGNLPEKFNGVSDACILVDKNSDKIFLAGLGMHGVLMKKESGRKGSQRKARHGTT